MLSKNGIVYTRKKAIKYDGKLEGWKLYKKHCYLGGSKFVGYMWKTKTGKAIRE